MIYSKYAYVVLAVSCSKRKPYFICGCGASETNIDYAISKAYRELVVLLNESANNNSDNYMIDKSCITLPQEHGYFYLTNNNMDSIKFLWDDDEVSYNSLSNIKLTSINQIPFIFIFYKQLCEKIHVIRAFSPQLIPIHFGYMNDYYLHEEVKKVLCNSYDFFPHFFN